MWLLVNIAIGTVAYQPYSVHEMERLIVEAASDRCPQEYADFVAVRPNFQNGFNIPSDLLGIETNVDAPWMDALLSIPRPTHGLFETEGDRIVPLLVYVTAENVGDHISYADAIEDENRDIDVIANARALASSSLALSLCLMPTDIEMDYYRSETNFQLAALIREKMGCYQWFEAAQETLDLDYTALTPQETGERLIEIFKANYLQCEELASNG